MSACVVCNKDLPVEGDEYWYHTVKHITPEWLEKVPPMKDILQDHTFMFSFGPLCQHCQLRIYGDPEIGFWAPPLYL
jgi:hypothetical protein